MTTISASSTIGIYLTTSSFSNPIVINSGVTITGDYRGDAIYAYSGFWTITNSGTVSGTGANVGGIHLGAGGVVTNQATGFIGLPASNSSDIYITGGTGTVTNFGTIKAGVWLQTGGVVTNESGATIISSDPSGGYAVGMYAGGTVINAGEMRGLYLGIDVSAGGGTVTNQTGGTISGPYVGVLMAFPGHASAGGRYLVNQSGGTISGASGVITGGTSARVINAGDIIGTLASTITHGMTITLVTGAGVSMDSGGTITNELGGTIIGASYGVNIGNGAGTVVNDGSIASTGTGGRGIVLEAGGSIRNTGAISSATGAGIYVKAGASTVVNAGLVFSGGSHSAVALFGGGAITNQSGGTLGSAGSNAVYIKGAGGTVVNAGQITAGGTHSAVVLDDGGYVTNQSGGTITATTLHNAIYTTGTVATVTNYGLLTYGVNLNAGGLVTNETGGTITDQGGSGVQLHASGSVINDTAATITGTNGVQLSGGPGSVINAGMVASSGTGRSAIGFAAGGYVRNQHGGTVSSALQVGVFFNTGVGTVVNSGDIAGHANGTVSYPGVDLVSGGVVTNTALGTITGGNEGVFVFSGSGTVVNDGSIAGAIVDGVLFNAGGTLSNGSSASITGNRFGVFLATGGTLTNAGTIVGNSGTAVAFGGAGSDLLVLDPGADFSGMVVGGAVATSTLELASATSAGTVTGLGTDFTNFGSIVFDPGADWFISGNTTGLAGTISGFAFGDTVEVTGITAIGSSYSGGVLTLTEASGSATLTLPGSFTTTDFMVRNVAAGADISLAAPCFVAGTRIQTERGAVAVEALREGDRVQVLLGGKAQRIIWVGHRRVDCGRHPKPTEVWPVCLSAGAFGPDRPFRDLWLSPDHALFINGVLIPIRYLVNGRTIRQVARDEVTYWHVELAAHNVLFAEGVPAESYLDTGDRSGFSNGGAAVDLHVDFARNVWEAQGCAPLVVHGPVVAAANRRLLARARAIGRPIEQITGALSVAPRRGSIATR